MAEPSTITEGELQITLDVEAEQPVRIKSTRPLQVSQLFIGNSIDQVAETVPLLYNVCATAQTHASLLALNRAGGWPINRQVEIARAILMFTETIREHLLRISIDWPELYDDRLDTTVLPSISRLLPGMTNCLFDPAGAFSNHSALALNRASLQMMLGKIDELIEKQICTIPIQHWLSIKHVEDLTEWARRGKTLAARAVEYVLQQGWGGFGQCPVAALPTLHSDQLLAVLRSDQAAEFVQAPTWQGQVYETGVFTRQQSEPLVQALSAKYGNGLLPRMIARLVELVSLPDRLRLLIDRLEADDRNRVCPTDGLAQVEAARGHLVHYAEVKDDRVTDYRILAPTEWNFHSQGVMAQSLQQLLQDTDQQQEQVARCLINAIDPCVGYKLDIRP
jgi:hypothetical protein